MQQKSTLRLYDNRASPDGNFQAIALAGRPGEWTKRYTGKRVTHCSCALLPQLMWLGPYCELYCHAVCTWKFWNLPLSWFVNERMRLNLINPGLLKKQNAVCTWRCWTLPLLQFDRERMQLVHEVILLNKILRSHLLSENMQWNYASFNVTLNYLMHEIMEFCVTSLALDNWEQKYFKLLAISRTIYTVCCEDDYCPKENLNYFTRVSKR